MAKQSDRERLGAWAVMLNPDLNIDRRKNTRTVPLEVLSLGFSRTGTLSLHEAYTILGYQKPYHYASVIENVKDADIWQEALNYKNQTPRLSPSFWRDFFDGVLGHCGAITDTPAVIFWRELVEAYPEAKIVLVERNVETWYRSCCVLVDGILDPFLTYVLRFTDPFWLGRIINLGRAWVGDFFGSKDAVMVKRNAKEAYLRHYAEIRRVVPRERTLEFDLADGWKPLCDFLGKEIPDTVFPKRNEAKTIELAFQTAGKRALIHSAQNIGIVLGLIAVCIGFARQGWLGTSWNSLGLLKN